MITFDVDSCYSMCGFSGLTATERQTAVLCEGGEDLVINCPPVYTVQVELNLLKWQHLQEANVSFYKNLE